ncbi:MAG: helix-turn-helix transcriptional regulator [Cyclobacteriaceae bacterium]|nr:helix-turn-helix transcriptional regulator [Cyclobacteriaceae bacterium]
MKAFKLHIKNMLCERCIYVVKQILNQFNVLKVKIELGHVSFLSADEDILPLLEKKLSEFNLRLIYTKEEKCVEAIKLAVKQYLDEIEQFDRSGKFSVFISRRLSKNYQNLSKLFSRAEKVTIETYLIRQKTERAKRLLREGQLSLNEIADRLHYSNVQHLSSQFRNVTGFSAREYKKLQLVDHPHRSIAQVLAEIRAKGYLSAFDIVNKNNIVLADQTRKLKDVSIKEVYRFDENPNLLGQNAIYTVEDQNGNKGYLICQH